MWLRGVALDDGIVESEVAMEASLANSLPFLILSESQLMIP